MIRLSTILAFIFIGLSYNSKAQNKNKYTSGVRHEFHGDIELFSDNYDAEFNVWYNMRIIYKGHPLRIKGYDSKESASNFHFERSFNKRYIVLDNIDVGWVENDKGRVKHGVYMCIIVDIIRRRVIYQMHHDCDGKWNKYNQWIASGKIVFDTNNVR